MKVYKYIAAGIIFAMITAFTVHPDKDFLLLLKQKSEAFPDYYPQEKVYVQTDKTFYKQEENIWFNVFLLDAFTHKPSVTSDVVYVELSDPKGNVIEKRDLLVSNGVVRGDFELSDAAPGGIYTLVAYTRWMKNFGEECFFKKELTVQKVITPRLLLKLDFEKKAYGPGDEVTAFLTVENLNNQKISGGLVKSSVRISGNETAKFNTTTDGEGKARIVFRLPESLQTTDGMLQLIVSDKGLEESISRSIPIVLNNIKLQFFPEGGDLCENVTSRVAFEALSEFGKGADISGEIVDETGKVITSFESFHQGMGAFDFTPQQGKTYSARIIRPVGNSAPVLLPQALRSAYVLNSKEQTGTKIVWMVYAPEAGNVVFTGQVRGKLYENRLISLKKGINTIETQLGDFPAGIAVFTLFDTNNREACERLAFVNTNKTLIIDVKPEKSFYKPGESVKLEIQTRNVMGKPVAADMALSVVDRQLLSFADDKQDNMLTYMLLSSELKGKIHEPSFYFDKKEKKAPAAIDYLMLTHGWRRFTWNDVMNPQFKAKEGAEKISDVYGYVVDKKGNPKQTEVYLIEYGPKRRIAKLKTTSGGQFVFHNVDISGNVTIATRLPNQVFIFQKRPVFRSGGLQSNPDLIENAVTGKVEEEYETEVRDEVSNTVAFNQLDKVNLTEDYSRLDEVVVVGYGSNSKRTLTGAVSVVNSREIELDYISIESALQGRISGLVMPERSISPGKNTVNAAVLNGINSLATGSSYPVLVLDGVLLNETLNPNFSAWDLVNSNNVKYVTVLNASTASSIYGSRAGNGAIVVTSKTTGFPYIETKKKFAGTVIPKRYFYQAEDFEENSNNSGERKNFNTTVYWDGQVKTDENGKATVTFRNNDATSAFNVTAEGISAEGLIGHGEAEYSTRLPVSLDVKMPEFITMNDMVDIPITIKNTTDTDRKAKVTVMTPVSENVRIEKMLYHIQMNQEVTVAKGETKTLYYRLTGGKMEGKRTIVIQMWSDDYQDKISRTLYVRSTGFPKSVSISGKKTDKTGTFVLNDVEGFVTMEATCYTNILDDLKAGTENILRQPHGCFEQVSSSTFPNIFALQFMKSTKKINPEVEKRALEFIEDGYKQLAAYEVRGGGFEWYGGSPAHEVLSAYGLLEFHEMKKVYSGVLEGMMKRTLDFILSRRDGKGGFKQNKGKYGFSAAPEHINNAYIVYALTETGYKDISIEYESCLKEARGSKDPYRMALMANAAFSLGKTDDYKELTAYFTNLVRTPGLNNMKIENSIVRSYGKPLLNETLALWCIAILKDDKMLHFPVLDTCMQVIADNRSSGGFGGTQATSLCLQALTKYAQFSGTGDSDGKFEVILNDTTVVDKAILPGQSFAKTEVNPPFPHYGYRSGKNTVRVRTNVVNPYSVNISWSTLQIPESSKLCPLKLSAILQEKQVKVNETVRLSVALVNTREHTGLPMSIAVVGIPAGLSLQPWQLKEMQEKEVFDFYEIIDDKLVAYYREFGPGETRQINLDLKAEIPGKYTAAASSAYLYYSDEFKYWIKGCSVEVTK